MARPDRRGMGAQSDFVSEEFVPDEKHKALQLEAARILIASGMPREKVAALLTIPVDLLSE